MPGLASQIVDVYSSLILIAHTYQFLRLCALYLAAVQVIMRISTYRMSLERSCFENLRMSSNSSFIYVKEMKQKHCYCLDLCMHVWCNLRKLTTTHFTIAI